MKKKNNCLMSFIYSAVALLLGMLVLSEAAFAGHRFASNIRYAGIEGDDCSRCYEVTYNTETRRPMIVFIHGGGWFTGDHRSLNFRRLARTYYTQGYDVAVVGYRKLYLRDTTGPQRRINFSKQVYTIQQIGADVATAIRDIRDRFSPTRIILIGHSAGAHIAALVASSPTLLMDVGLNHSDISDLVLLDGHTYDLRRSQVERPYWLTAPNRHYNLYGTDFRDASPVYHSVRVPRDEHPRVFIVTNRVATQDNPYFLHRSFEQSARYYRVLRRFGYEAQFRRYPTVYHHKLTARAYDHEHPLFHDILEFLNQQPPSKGKQSSETK